MGRTRALLMAMILALGMLGVPGANAGGVDFGRMQCGQYLALLGKLAQTHRMQSASGILMWVYGYASHESHNASIDQGQFRRFANELGRQCSAHPDAPLLATVKRVGVR